MKICSKRSFDLLSSAYLVSRDDRVTYIARDSQVRRQHRSLVGVNQRRVVKTEQVDSSNVAGSVLLLADS